VKHLLMWFVKCLLRAVVRGSNWRKACIEVSLTAVLFNAVMRNGRRVRRFLLFFFFFLETVFRVFFG
jgi:hypothetical protein